MKFTSSVAPLLLASMAVATTHPMPREKLVTIEVAPGEYKQVTENERWRLRTNGAKFFDVTGNEEIARTEDFEATAVAVAFPEGATQQEKVNSLISGIKKGNLETNLAAFTRYTNRYYQSTTGRDSSLWLQQQISAVVNASGATGVTVAPFKHSFVQNSIVAKIPGKTAKTIVVGAHLDSVNGRNRNGPAPGVDDNATGSVTILEALRVLLGDETFKSGQAENTVEFHWYAGEEAGLLGSQDIFRSYKSAGRDVAAMLNQDMTGYTADSDPEVMGVVQDFVDKPLTAYVTKLIGEYCAIPAAETNCGYACSDHGSASRSGFPSAFVFESNFDDSNPSIHTPNDTIEKINYNHIVEHVKLVLGFTVELGLATGL